jgi:hypothetical protein
VLVTGARRESVRADAWRSPSWAAPALGTRLRTDSRRAPFTFRHARLTTRHRKRHRVEHRRRNARCRRPALELPRAAVRTRRDARRGTRRIHFDQRESCVQRESRVQRWKTPARVPSVLPARIGLGEGRGAWDRFGRRHARESEGRMPEPRACRAQAEPWRGEAKRPPEPIPRPAPVTSTSYDSVLA